MDNTVKKIYVCPFCAAKLNEQEGFDEKEDTFKCVYCGNDVKLSATKKEDVLTKEVDRFFKKAGPVLEFGAGLALIALGTALSAAEYVIEKNAKSSLSKNETPVSKDTEDDYHNII